MRPLKWRIKMNRRDRRMVKRNGIYVKENPFEKKKEIKIVISVPSTSIVNADFSMSFALITYIIGCVTKGAISPVLHNHKGSQVDKARREGVELMQQVKAWGIQFYDSDMVFKPDIFIQMFNKMFNKQYDILGCNYPRRDRTYTSTAIGLDGKELPSDNQGDVKVKGMGCGCMLIKANVFDKIEKPYFLHELGKSEDLYFCDKAREAGFDLWCDTELSREVVHLGDTAYSFKDLYSFENPGN